MILGFKKEFIDDIMIGRKIHTIRKDSSNRWREGSKIHFATNISTRDQQTFLVKECTGTEIIEIAPHRDEIIVSDGVRRYMLDRPNRILLANNDGFVDQFDMYLFFDYKNFKGKLIHWGNFSYIKRIKAKLELL
jgi:hypothetical protein